MCLHFNYFNNHCHDSFIIKRKWQTFFPNALLFYQTEGPVQSYPTEVQCIKKKWIFKIKIQLVTQNEHLMSFMRNRWMFIQACLMYQQELFRLNINVIDIRENRNKSKTHTQSRNSGHLNRTRFAGEWVWFVWMI